MKLKASAASILVLAGIALSCQAALSQGAMGGAPGGPAMSPRVAPAPAPQGAPAGAIYGILNNTSSSGRAPAISENESPRPSDRNLPASGSPRQAPSKSPVSAGGDGTTGSPSPQAIVYPPALSHGGNPTVIQLRNQ